MRRRVAVVVEGHGEKESVPLLVRRIHEASAGLLFPDIRAGDILRISRSKLVHGPGELARSIELAARRVGADGAILVVLDADDDLPCKLAPKLLERAMERRPAMRIGVVLANRECEGWFLASAPSLGLGGQDLQAKAETKRDAKALVRQSFGHYSPVIDQPKLTGRMDLGAARENSPSFDKLWREVHRLLEADPSTASPTAIGANVERQ